jgi:hypothetical protein
MAVPHLRTVMRALAALPLCAKGTAMYPGWHDCELKFLEHKNRLSDADTHHRRCGKHLRAELVRPPTRSGTAWHALKALSFRVYEFVNPEINSSPVSERRGAEMLDTHVR